MMFHPQEARQLKSFITESSKVLFKESKVYMLGKSDLSNSLFLIAVLMQNNCLAKSFGVSTEKGRKIYRA